MQHPFFWNGVFVFWCCRDDLSFFRKGVAKICRQQPVSLFLHAVWAFFFVYPSIKYQESLRLWWLILWVHRCRAGIFCFCGSVAGFGLIFPFKIRPEETPRQWWFSPKIIHMESPKMKVPGSLSFVWFWMRESWNGFGSFDRFLLSKNCEAICFWCFKHLLKLSFWECSIEAGKVRSDHL